MLIIMKPQATPEDVERVADAIRAMGFTPHAIPGAERVAIGITGNDGPVPDEGFRAMEGVADTIRVTRPYKLVSREFHPDDSVVDVGGVAIGGPGIVVMAGPCSVESDEQIHETARRVAAAGAVMLRGGAYKPRTSPYAFQGLREEGLRLLDHAGHEAGLRVVTEVKDTETLPLVAEHADMLQVGARNMQNFSLLERLGEIDKPVLLKRGMAATIEELLLAAEYIVARGNPNVVLCERGVRTFEPMTRNTLDINAIPVLKTISHLPVVVDPSHAIGIRAHVPAIARAAVAAGADGLIIEVHPRPEQARSDGHQSLSCEEFAELMRQVEVIAKAIDRPVARAVASPQGDASPVSL